MSDNPNSILNVKVPQPSVPFLDGTGNVSREWFYFLLSLYARTGGPTPPPVPVIPIPDQVQAAFSELAMIDINEALVPVSFPILMADGMADMMPPASLNPFLAAMLVADANIA